MQKYKGFLGIAAAVAAVIAPAVASAACTQANFAGRWHVYSSGVQGGQAGWARCRVIISANGAVTNTTCVAPNGANLPLTGGRVTLLTPAVCVFGGRFDLAGSEQQVRHLTLSLDKQTASGVGFAPSAGAFTLQMVKTGP